MGRRIRDGDGAVARSGDSGAVAMATQRAAADPRRRLEQAATVTAAAMATVRFLFWIFNFCVRAT